VQLPSVKLSVLSNTNEEVMEAQKGACSISAPLAGKKVTSFPGDEAFNKLMNILKFK
jgi:hypothetical protein